MTDNGSPSKPFECVIRIDGQEFFGDGSLLGDAIGISLCEANGGSLIESLRVIADAVRTLVEIDPDALARKELSSAIQKFLKAADQVSDGE